MNTRTILNTKLDNIREEVFRMAALVEENLASAATALREGDPDLAGMVKVSDTLVDSLQLTIEDETAALMATQSPVARDLRELVCVFKLTGNLERAGDYAVHLARAAAKLSGDPSLRCLDRLDSMAKTGGQMIRAAMEAYRNHDAAAARRTAAMDDDIDWEHRALTEELLTLIRKHPELTKKAVRILSVSGFLERLGDHVTNICEAVIYMVESKHEELN
ncbi:phosphate signaling complex protein PhoU [Breznakiella homolactica]|uniref:Phosphate-specific transport system accessory protein PhoU n=1 Tax=Breznakiella homolactica TaxID=2798577 RepID=A0A7T8B9E6_9SPIR|nr:phosphate signaling complex protein PhoU [Breznakiella homolactica]QQO07880.1 phosphate signaling complex protein PhoU [Breznakiella homolactica]